MTPNQNKQEEVQEDINARLALISKAVEEKLLGQQQSASGEGRIQEQDTLVVSACPIDPMERLQCESCQ